MPLTINRLLPLLLFCAAALTTLTARPQAPGDDPGEAPAEAAGEASGDGGDDDAAVRINPEVDFASAADTVAADTAAAAPLPAYIRPDANRINLNGADWSALAARLGGAATSTVSIVHIGDSHLQADVATSVVRRRLQARYGDGGRGLVAPLKMAGTNEPRDYSLRATRPAAWTAAKLMKRPWAVEVGFTGVAAAPTPRRGALTVATLSRTATPQLFDRVRIFHSVRPLAVEAIGGGEASVALDSLASVVALPAPTDSLTVGIDFFANGAVYGLSLERTQPGGLLYHVIGNNGAAYVSYNAINGFADGVALLRPSLLIVSLGANEAFSRMTAEEMRASMAAMVGQLRRACPDAPLLLTTPMECQRSSYTRRRKGRRRVRTYAVNTRVAEMRNAILSYGREQGIATYDFYAVAGGAGASARWVADGLMARDRIHCSAGGYDLQGRLLYEALQDAFAAAATGDKPTTGDNPAAAANLAEP